MEKEVLEAFMNTPVGSAPDVPPEHQVKQEKILKMENMSRFFPLGTPCKALHTGFGVVGRYIGNANEGSGMESSEGEIWSVILVSTPGGTIIKTGRCYVNFELSEEELATLNYYENETHKTESKSWYHGAHEQSEVDALGKVIPWSDIKPLSI